MRPPAPHLRAVLALLPVAVTAATCATPPVDGPAAPYDHPPMDESSTASAVRLGGEVQVLAEGLTDAGFFCAQVRRNAAAVQVWCRPETPGTEVHLLASPTGDLRYADVALPFEASYAADLQPVLDASFLRLWPQDRDDLAELAEDVPAPEPAMRFGSDGGPRTEEEQYYDVVRSTGKARYTAAVSWGSPLGLRVRTPQLTDRSWPFGADSYARRFSDAAAELAAPGLECNPAACYDPSSVNPNGAVISFTTDADFDGTGSGDQIVSATIEVPMDAAVSGRTDLATPGWALEPLRFLTPAVGAAVTEAITECVSTGRGSRAIRAGAVVVIDARGTEGYPDDPPTTCAVQVGVPLLYVE
jgi:hypothetical protein